MAPEEIDVLVVDDDDDARAVLTMFFRHAGFSVAEARNGTEAFVTVCRRPVRAIVLDLMMPDIGGFDVLNALRSQPESWDIKIAMLTCVSTEDAAREAWSLGADDYLRKPIDPEVVVTRVSRLLTASRAAIRARRETALLKLAAP